MQFWTLQNILRAHIATSHLVLFLDAVSHGSMMYPFAVVVVVFLSFFYTEYVKEIDNNFHISPSISTYQTLHYLSSHELFIYVQHLHVYSKKYR